MGIPAPAQPCNSGSRSSPSLEKGGQALGEQVEPVVGGLVLEGAGTMKKYAWEGHRHKQVPERMDAAAYSHHLGGRQLGGK